MALNLYWAKLDGSCALGCAVVVAETTEQAVHLAFTAFKATGLQSADILVEYIQTASQVFDPGVIKHAEYVE